MDDDVEYLDKLDEIRKQKQREYYQKNKDKFYENSKRWSKKNKEHKNEYNRKYYKKNPEKRKASNKRYAEKITKLEVVKINKPHKVKETQTLEDVISKINYAKELVNKYKKVI